MGRILHISKSEIAKQSELLFNLVRSGESAVCMCYPTCGIDYLLSCLLSGKILLKKNLGKYYKKVVFVKITLDSDSNIDHFQNEAVGELSKYSSLEASVDFEKCCSEIVKSGRELYFLITNCHKPAKRHIQKIVNSIHKQISKSNRINASLFFEANIFTPDTEELFVKNHKFLRNILYFPVYSKKESLLFIDNLCSGWGKKINNRVKSAIVDNFGGFLWFLREAARYYLDTNNADIEELVKSPGIRIRVKVLLSLLSTNDKKVIADLIENKSFNRIEAQFLLKNGFIAGDKGQELLSMPILSKYYAEYFMSADLVVNNREVLANGKPVSKFLSKSEKKALLLLYQNRGNIVEREMVAQVLWGDSWHDSYSDWAIDKLVSRLRKKLISFDLPKYTLITHKKQGFLIN